MIAASLHVLMEIIPVYWLKFVNFIILFVLDSPKFITFMRYINISAIYIYCNWRIKPKNPTQDIL